MEPKRPRRSPLDVVKGVGVAKKIYGLAAVLLVCMLGLGLMSWRSLNAVESKATAMSAAVKTASDPLSVVHQDELKARMLVAPAAAARTDEQIKGWVDQIPATDAELAAAQKTATAAFTAAHAPLQTWDAFRNNWATWLQFRDKQLLPLIESNNPGESLQYAALAAGDGQKLVDAAAAGLDQTERL